MRAFSVRCDFPNRSLFICFVDDCKAQSLAIWRPAEPECISGSAEYPPARLSFKVAGVDSAVGREEDSFRIRIPGCVVGQDISDSLRRPNPRLNVQRLHFVSRMN